MFLICPTRRPSPSFSSLGNTHNRISLHRAYSIVSGTETACSCCARARPCRAGRKQLIRYGRKSSWTREHGRQYKTRSMYEYSASNMLYLPPHVLLCLSLPLLLSLAVPSSACIAVLLSSALPLSCCASLYMYCCASLFLAPLPSLSLSLSFPFLARLTAR